MRKLIVFLGAVLVSMVATSASAQEIPSNRFDLGTNPIGTVIDLPSWACGNITVSNYDDSVSVMTLTFNAPRNLVHPEDYALIGVRKGLRVGQIMTVRLKNDTRFSYYWKKEVVDGMPRLLLTVNRHCPAGGCDQLCDYQHEDKTWGGVRGCESKKAACLSITAEPWATVKWLDQTGEASYGKPLVIVGLPIGTYTFTFDHPIYGPIERKIAVTGAKQSCNVDLSRDAPVKPFSKPK